MNIPHLVCTKGTKFYPIVSAQLTDVGLPSIGHKFPIVCEFAHLGGYGGDVVVRITVGVAEFEADWDGKDRDCSRFPARIRAAATALRDAGFQGDARISHEDGRLTIRLVG